MSEPGKQIFPQWNLDMTTALAGILIAGIKITKQRTQLNHSGLR
jgi:hypothetical protein